MTDIGVNYFISTVFNQLYATQNATGNIAFNGLGLYVVMAAINFGLRGRSYEQLLRVIGEDFEELYDAENWADSDLAWRWADLRHIAEASSNMKAGLLCSCDIYTHYQEISKLMCRLAHLNVNVSNPTDAVGRMNRWISLNMRYRSDTSFFDESIVGGERILMIYTLFLQIDWRTNFNDSLTKQEIFYDDEGQLQEVSMMNQESFNLIYESPDDNFRILFKRLTHPLFYTAIVLPRDGMDVKDVLKSFKTDKMDYYFENSSIRYVKLKIPKFKISSQIDLIKTLKEFGITDIFDPHFSDFGRMTNRSVFIGNFIQVAHITAREGGETTFEDIVAPDEQLFLHPYEFYVKRPFMIFVYSPLENLVCVSIIVTNPNAA
ncbi:Glia-derived nexin [Thelohanellus kitauei]|uniref:Glia-derived nexin n=1 Tax=Thelohanellus kitauei TaxID=669202 RepID=A0A0C2MNE2_THEKT|nr:Glia-derived nexin [Thelohanellus kitauei]